MDPNTRFKILVSQLVERWLEANLSLICEGQENVIHARHGHHA